MQDEALFGFMVWRSLFAGLTEYEMTRNYVLIVDEAKSPSSLPIFNVARWKKKKNRKRNTNRKRTAKKRPTMYYSPPPSFRVDKTLSCLPGAPASMLREKDKHKKTRQPRQEAHRERSKQPFTPRPHNVATNLRISSFALLSGRAREPEPSSVPPFVFFGR